MWPCSGVAQEHYWSYWAACQSLREELSGSANPRWASPLATETLWHVFWLCEWTLCVSLRRATGFVLPTEDRAFAWDFTPVDLERTALWKLHWKQGSQLSIQLEHHSLVISMDLNCINYYLVLELALSCSVQHICLSLCLTKVCVCAMQCSLKDSFLQRCFGFISFLIHQQPSQCLGL